MKYNVIYADPPWEYDHKVVGGNSKSGAQSQYITQSNESLFQIDVKGISDKNCVLLMWATFPKLKEALELGEMWGFVYKTVAFTWIKKNKVANTPFFGMGSYTRSNAEIVLLFTKGKPLPRISQSVEQILFSEIGKHSQKPHEIRKRIVDLFGDIPRIELFARTREGMFGDMEYEGWDVYGNQVNNSIVI